MFTSYINNDDNNLRHLSGEGDSTKMYLVWPFKSQVWGSALEKRMGESYAEVNLVMNAVLPLLPLNTQFGMLVFQWQKSSFSTWICWSYNLEKVWLWRKRDVCILCHLSTLWPALGGNCSARTVSATIWINHLKIIVFILQRSLVQS